MSESFCGLVVFDCDGVLVDSERLHIEVDVRAIRELGWPITFEEVVERHMGRSEADQLADIEAVTGRPVPSDWVARWSSAYGAAYETELVALPGVSGAIETLVAAGWQVCVATSGSRVGTWRKLRICGLDGWFADERIFTAADVARGKPAPDLFLLAASSLGFAPGACVVVEDSRHGVAAARAAGMPCVGFAGGIGPVAWLADATVILDDLATLPRVVASLGENPPR